MERTPQQKVDLLWDRFVHRTDSYTTQWYDKDKGGGYWRARSGKCTHEPLCSQRKTDCPDIIYHPLTKKQIVEHLQGTITVGAYAADADDTVKWLCLDMDIRKGETGDVQKLTLDVALFLLQHVGRDCFRVEYSGQRGYHLWVFFAEPVTATEAHSLGVWIRNHVPHAPEVGIEIYPKQVNVYRVGNPVKIPLGVHQKTGQRCLFVRGDFTPYDDQWEVLETIKPMTRDELTELIHKNNIYQVETAPPPTLNPNMNMPCMTRIMEEGLPEGSRDVGFFRLALFLKDRGLPFEVALDVMENTNQRCDPPFENVQEKAYSAYSSDYSVFPCYDPAFDEFCSSSCRYFPRKRDSRGNNNPAIIKRLSRD